MAIAFICRHILQIPATQIFTTRDMLIYGKRSAVDSAMCRLVASGFVTRLARGVFVRDASENPSFVEIVKAKTRAFMVSSKKHIETHLKTFRLSPDDSQLTFARIGHTSSFMTIHGRAYIRGVSEKKLRLLDSKVGQVAAALWFLKEDFCSYAHVGVATRWFNRYEKEQFWMHSKLMPAWLTKICAYFFPQPKLMTEPYFNYPS